MVSGHHVVHLTLTPPLLVHSTLELLDSHLNIIHKMKIRDCCLNKAKNNVVVVVVMITYILFYNTLVGGREG